MANYSFSYQEYDNINSLEDIKQKLVHSAIEAATKAYAPYSNFKVGCSVLMKNHKVIQGANVENASYPVGICAERTALSYVVSNLPKDKILSMAISYLSDNEDDEVIFPCGMCRQFILECQERNKKNIELILHAPNGKILVIADAANLLPFGFTGEML